MRRRPCLAAPCPHLDPGGVDVGADVPDADHVAVDVAADLKARCVGRCGQRWGGGQGNGGRATQNAGTCGRPTGFASQPAAAGTAQQSHPKRAEAVAALDSRTCKSSTVMKG